jgi:hypothetical protein
MRGPVAPEQDIAGNSLPVFMKSPIRRANPISFRIPGANESGCGTGSKTDAGIAAFNQTRRVDPHCNNKV